MTIDDKVFRGLQDIKALGEAGLHFKYVDDRYSFYVFEDVYGTKYFAEKVIKYNHKMFNIVWARGG